MLDLGHDLVAGASADHETGRRPPAMESLGERRSSRESGRQWARARIVAEVLIVGGLIGFAWFERGTVERSVTFVHRADWKRVVVAGSLEGGLDGFCSVSADNPASDRCSHTPGLNGGDYLCRKLEPEAVPSYEPSILSVPALVVTVKKLIRRIRRRPGNRCSARPDGARAPPLVSPDLGTARRILPRRHVRSGPWDDRCRRRGPWPQSAPESLSGHPADFRGRRGQVRAQHPTKVLAERTLACYNGRSLNDCDCDAPSRLLSSALSLAGLSRRWTVRSASPGDHRIRMASVAEPVRRDESQRRQAADEAREGYRLQPTWLSQLFEGPNHSVLHTTAIRRKAQEWRPHRAARTSVVETGRPRRGRCPHDQ